MGPDNACRAVILSEPSRPDEQSFLITQKLNEVKIGDGVTVFAKILHAQDPTQLLLKQLDGKVTCMKHCITFGNHSIYEENMKLEKESDRQWNTDLIAFKHLQS
mmetsp:Transcript_15755/g.37557  ORF Transcript_15755/g.37557 Transcript_15755/m.37557 type:complete len:104 (+) Transcript_15755:298-609(+)